MTNPKNSFKILPTKNSKNLLSPYYKNQIKLFLNKKYRKQKINLKNITTNKHKLLILKNNKK